MIGKKLLSQQAVPLFEVKEALKIRGKEDELTYEPVPQEWNLLSACARVVRRRAQLQRDLNPAETERLLETPRDGLISPTNGEL